ncbi:MAG: Rieske 2Fe-2S domain-containing protein [Pirellulales bacterium]|nr:Rieske 2Fe-2S domain-containing protein [Pirellulales bacterium]
MSTSSPAKQPSSASVDSQRRGFLVKLLAMLTGGLATLVPLGAGAFAFLDPLRKKEGDGGRLIRITVLDALRADGVPRQFPVIADRTDAWTHYAADSLGAVYLRRTGDRDVTALSATCPHAGCNVDFRAGDRPKPPGEFACPCHRSTFEPDGKRIDPEHCPSPRDLDPLTVELREQGGAVEVWIKFEKFLAGTAERIVTG